ncbi:MAG: hypothetical protein OXD42_08880, partial [Rhodospirillaceae bacterium]|nr:hypothetical protein [Rhodospirillaceae bacterium]
VARELVGFLWGALQLKTLKFDDHIEAETTFSLEEPTEDGKDVQSIEVPTRNAMNLLARQGYSRDCDIGVVRWNRMIRKAGVDFDIRLPSDRFRRTVGPFAGFHFAPDGSPIGKDAYDSNLDDWIPSETDKAHVKAQMKQVTEPGKMAAWIAPPDRGINNNPVDHDYVKL